MQGFVRRNKEAFGRKNVRELENLFSKPRNNFCLLKVKRLSLYMKLIIHVNKGHQGKAYCPSNIGYQVNQSPKRY